MKKLIILSALFLLSHPAYALLSPLNQSLEEIQSIIQGTELQKYIPQQQAITEIKRFGNGYLISTREVQMLVEIQYLPIERPGKQQFRIIYNEPVRIQR